MRIKMTTIPNNYLQKRQKLKCVCGEDEEMEHIYQCKILNKNKKTEIRYEEIYGNNLYKQIEIMKIFEVNLERRNTMKQTKNREIKETLEYQNFPILGRNADNKISRYL